MSIAAESMEAELDNDALVELLPVIAEENLDYAVDVYARRLYQTQHHEPALAAFRSFRRGRGRRLNVHMAGLLAAVFVTEPSCVADYNEICAVVQRLMASA